MISEKNFQQYLFHYEARPKDVRLLLEGLEDEEVVVERSDDNMSLPEAVVSAVFSVGVRPAAWQNTVARLNNFMDWEATDPDHRAISELQDKLSKDGAKLKRVLANRQRTSARGGVTKSKASRKMLRAFQKEDIDCRNDIDFDSLLRVYRRTRRIPGQREGIPFVFALMLMGWKDCVKPDRRILDYVSYYIGDCTPHYAAEVVRQAAYARDENPRDLDLAIWYEG